MPDTVLLRDCFTTHLLLLNVVLRRQALAAELFKTKVKEYIVSVGVTSCFTTLALRQSVMLNGVLKGINEWQQTFRENAGTSHR
jgi:hypothetical protein